MRAIKFEAERIHLLGDVFAAVAVVVTALGTLRSQDGNGRENVAEKVDSRSFNLHSDYSKSLTLWNVCEPCQSWIPKNHIQVQKEGGNFVVACVLPLYNVKLGISRRSRAVKPKYVQKRVMHVQSCCFGY